MSEDRRVIGKIEKRKGYVYYIDKEGNIWEDLPPGIKVREARQSVKEGEAIEIVEEELKRILG